MGAFDSNDPRDKALWELLGRSRQVEVSPHFARKVLRAIESKSGDGAIFRSGWMEVVMRMIAPAALCASLALLAIAGVRNAMPGPSIVGTEMEFETIQNLDLLVSNYESSLWLDPSSSLH